MKRKDIEYKELKAIRDCNSTGRTLLRFSDDGMYAEVNDKYGCDRYRYKLKNPFSFEDHEFLDCVKYKGH